MVMMKAPILVELFVLIGAIVAIRLDKVVEFKVIKRRTPFRYAPQICERYGYLIAPFYERLIPLILHSLTDANVDTVWGSGLSLAPATIIEKRSSKTHDLTATFVNRKSPRMQQRHAVLCVKAKSRVSKSNNSSYSSVTTGPSRVLPMSSSSSSKSQVSSSSKSSASVRHKRKKPKHYQKHSATKSNSTTHFKARQTRKKQNGSKRDHEGMVIVSRHKNPKFTIRIDGVQVDPHSSYVQQLIQQLRQVPLDQMKNTLHAPLNLNQIVGSSKNPEHNTSVKTKIIYDSKKESRGHHQDHATLRHQRHHK